MTLAPCIAQADFRGKTGTVLDLVLFAVQIHSVFIAVANKGRAADQHHCSVCANGSSL